MGTTTVVAPVGDEAVNGEEQEGGRKDDEEQEDYLGYYVKHPDLFLWKSLERKWLHLDLLDFGP